MFLDDNFAPNIVNLRSSDISSRMTLKPKTLGFAPGQIEVSYDGMFPLYNIKRKDMDKKAVKMDIIKQVFRSDHANKYDRKAHASKWLAPQIIFGLTYKYIQPDETILDIGIGTGLSSELFHKAGLRVYGLDFSPEMLVCCQAKNMAEDLKEHDLRNTPYPYKSDAVDHAVCMGVTHLFQDIGLIFREMSRIIKKNGFFSFVVAYCEEGEKRVKSVSPPHAQSKKVSIYSYPRSTIQALIEEHCFVLVHELQFLSSSIGNQQSQYRAYVIQNKINGGCS